MKKHFLKLLFLAAMILSLASCTDTIVYAPVVNASTIDSVPRSGVHSVESGETLYSISWRYGKDYRYLAQLNHISEPYKIHVGQQIRLKGKLSTPTSNKRLNASTVQSVEVERSQYVGGWQWPAQGQVVGVFSNSNKGINISGYLNQPVYASANGKVVYSGGGLRGYGNLIIIKHNSLFLTAYAHNNLIVVKEGENVKAGQIIGRMGSTGANRIMLHFEIREGGQPVNPLHYLETR